jgi:hypothetical protein
MKVTPLDLMIALGRKLEELKAADEVIDLSEEALEADKDLAVLLPFALMVGNLTQAMGLEPLSESNRTPEYIRQLEFTLAKYLPQ